MSYNDRIRGLLIYNWVGFALKIRPQHSEERQLLGSAIRLARSRHLEKAINCRREACKVMAREALLELSPMTGDTQSDVQDSMGGSLVLVSETSQF